jgi:hypothetical protein
MKFVLWLTILVAINCSAAFAAPEQCLSIKSKVDRQACSDRQANDLAAKRKAGLSDKLETMDPIAALKLEDDRLAKRLQGICRGC